MAALSRVSGFIYARAVILKAEKDGVGKHALLTVCDYCCQRCIIGNLLEPAVFVQLYKVVQRQCVKSSS